MINMDQSDYSTGVSNEGNIGNSGAGEIDTMAARHSARRKKVPNDLHSVRR